LFSFPNHIINLPCWMVQKNWISWRWSCGRRWNRAVSIFLPSKQGESRNL